MRVLPSTAKMTAISVDWKRGFDTLLRMVLAGVFIYAGATKLRDPLAFADPIAAFKILPEFLIAPVALQLPIFEIIVGVLLVIGWRRRTAALGVLLSMAIYTAAVSSALMRGLVLDCGCFGASAPSVKGMWLDLARDAVLLAAAFLVYWSTLTRGEGEPSKAVSVSESDVPPRHRRTKFLLRA